MCFFALSACAAYNEPKNSHLLELDQPWLSPENLQLFAATVYNKGAALNNCWGFVDGTVRPICRPQRYQRAVYNGHKRVHAIKFQSDITPNGMIANLYGPVEGRRHDSGMLAMSGLLELLEQHLFSPTGQALCIYGDPAYPHRLHLQCPFARRAVFTPEEQAFNHSLSQVRVSVEWVFGDIVNYFKFVDFKKNLKINLLTWITRRHLTLLKLFRSLLIDIIITLLESMETLLFT